MITAKEETILKIGCYCLSLLWNEKLANKGKGQWNTLKLRYFKYMLGLKWTSCCEFKMKVFFVLLNVIHLVVSLSQSKLNIKFKVANKSKWDLLMKSSEILPPPRKETINLGILDSISSSKPWRSIAISMSLTSKPLATKTVTSMIVFSIGNFIAQTFFRKVQKTML